MLGPDTAAYLIVAAFLFATGALGVLIRRSPLIVLLSLEIMLNGGEPRADRVLPALRERRRPDLRAGGDGGRRLRGRRRARADRGDGPQAARPRRRQALDPARMTARRLDLPAAAARRDRADHAARRTRSRGARRAGSPRSRPARAFAAAVSSSSRCSSRSPEDRSETSTAYNWLVAGNFKVGFSILTDPLSVFMMLIVTGVGSLIVAYSLGYMDGDDEERRYFAYMSLFVFSMLMLVQGGNLLFLLDRLGPGRPLVVPADRLPPRAAERGRRRQEGVHHERVRRRDDGARASSC